MLTILNTREVKKIREATIKQFGYFFTDDYAFLMNENNRVFMVNKDVGRLELKNLIIDRLGLYVGELMLSGEFRLSKEGAQFLATKGGKKIENIVGLNEQEIKEYFQGNDLTKDLGKESKLIILSYKEDVLGCAKYKEGKILNFMPKNYRGEVIV